MDYRFRTVSPFQSPRLGRDGLGGVTGSVAVIRWLLRSAYDFGAISAPPHISPQVTWETAMRVCTAQKHIAGHGSAASRGG
jgi:hypothetical protein